MALSFAGYSGDGSNKNFAVPFEYISKSDVTVSVNGVSVTFVWLSASLVQTAVAPAGGTYVEVRRTTVKDHALVDFEDASTLTESDLDLFSAQMLYISQETYDRLTSVITVNEVNQFDATGRRIVNTADPVDDQDVVTKKWLLTNMASSLAQAIAARDAAYVARDAAAGSQATASSAATTAVTQASIAVAQAVIATNKAVEAAQSTVNAIAARDATYIARDAAQAYATAAANSATAAATSASSASADKGTVAADKATVATDKATTLAAKDAAAASAAAAAESARQAAEANGGALLPSNNLSDVVSKSQSMLNLGGLDLSTTVDIAGTITITSSGFGKLHFIKGTAANYTITLPSPVGNGGKMLAFMVDRPANASKLYSLVTPSGVIGRQGATFIMWASETVLLRSDGANWLVLDGRPVPFSGSLGQSGGVGGYNASFQNVSWNYGFGDPTGLNLCLGSSLFRAPRNGSYHFTSYLYVTASGGSYMQTSFDGGQGIMAQLGSLTAGTCFNAGQQSLSAGTLTSIKLRGDGSSLTVAGNLVGASMTYLEAPQW